MPTYRPVPEADDEAFRAIVAESFSPEDGPFDPEAAPEPSALAERRGRYVDGDLVAVCAHYDMTVAVRGADRPAGGVSIVASPPERRRRGHVRELLAASLSEYREDGRRLALLWPFDHRFYRRLGWGAVSRRAEWTIEVDALRGAALDAGDGAFQRLGPDDWAELAPVLADDDHAADLALRRTEAWWRERIFDRWDSTPFVSGWRDGDGDLRAYVAYHVDDAGDDRTLVVRDHAAADRRARRRLLGLLANHDSQVERVELTAPAGTAAGDPAAGFDYREALADPTAAEVTVRAGGMARVVDVAADLPALADDDAADRLAGRTPFDLAVSDPIAPWNDARFRVGVDGGVAVERVDAAGAEAESGGADDPPVVDCRIDALSRAVVGARAPGRLAAAGDLDGDDGAVAALAALFPSRRVWLREGF